MIVSWSCAPSSPRTFTVHVPYVHAPVVRSAKTFDMPAFACGVLTAIKPQPLERLDGDLGLAIVDPARNPETEIRDKDGAAVLRQCLGALSREHSEIIDLVYYQQESIKDVADVLGIPLNTVKTRMFYARKRLAMLLRAVGVDRLPT